MFETEEEKIDTAPRTQARKKHLRPKNLPSGTAETLKQWITTH